MIKNITRNIGIIGPLLVKVLCFINESKTGENQGFYKKRSFSKWITGSINNKEVSLTYDYATFIILDYNARGKEKEFNKNKNIMIPIFQVPALIKFLRQSLKMFEYDDTYYYEAHGTDKKLCLYSESSKYITVSKMFIRDCMLSSQLTIVHFEYENKDYEGLRINNNILSIKPCIPKNWDKYSIQYKYGESIYNIKVNNISKVSTGVRRVLIDGVETENKILLDSSGKVFNIDIEM